MKHVFGAALGFALLCLAWAQTNAPAFANTQLQLPLFEGSTVVSQSEDDDGDSEVVFTSDADLQTIFDFFHEQFVAAGWTQTEVDSSEREIEAEYRLDDQEIDVELELRADGSYELDIDLED